MPTHHRQQTQPTKRSQASDARMREMQQRLDSTEARQNTIISFLGRVAHNPGVLQQVCSLFMLFRNLQERASACLLPAAWCLVCAPG